MQQVTKSGRRVLAVASGGGHWEQLMLLRPALAQYDVRYATTHPDIAHQRGIAQVDTLPDCNQHKPVSSALCGFVALWVVLKHRPHVVLSTGAAPGFFCLMAGRLIGARTLWIDSVANGEQLSMCGKTALPLAEFEASLLLQIEREKERGAKVALLAPLPAGSHALNQRLQPYREAVARMGQSSQIPVFDPAEALAECAASEPLLSFDALHLNAQGHRCVGEWLATKICPPDSD